MAEKYLILKNNTTTLYFLKVVLEEATTDFCDYEVGEITILFAS